jgi:murein peptide amidase A
VRLKHWIILIEGILLLIAILAIFFAVKILNTEQIESTDSTLSIGGCKQTISVGTSVSGISIDACQLNGSNPEAENTLLVIGTIHGDEPDGKRVIDELASSGAPANTNIWLISDGNPDGSKLATRKNANEVDINRNFSIKWAASEPTARTYSGPSPASEPETLALMNAVETIKPTHVLVFHQPFEQIDCPPERPTTISDRLSQLTGYKSECIPGERSGSPTNSYTGTFTIWTNSTFSETTAVTFELGVETPQPKIELIAKALRILASDGAYLP